MSKFAELPDGTKLEFPDDTTDDVIDSTVKKHLGVSATPKSLADQIPGLMPEGTPAPAPAMSWKHLVAPLETGLSVGTGLLFGSFGNAVGSSQDAIDGTFNSKGPGPKAQQYAEALTWEPRLDESKALTEEANKLLMKAAGPLASIIPQLEAGTVFRGMKKDFNKGKAKVAEEAQLLEAIKKQQEQKAATTPVEPTGDLIGAQFGGRQAMPWDTPAETVPKSPLELELVPQGERGLFGDNPRATPQEALATNHTNPTIDFPLRQEVLEQPEIKAAIDNFRQQAAELEQVANNAISERVRENARTQLTALQEEFGRGMEQMGILQPSDAYGRGLYEARGENTTGAVQHTFNPKGQEGAFKFFVKEEKFDDFAKRVRELSPDISSADIDALWQERGNKAKQEITNVKLAKGLTNTETLGGIKLESITPEQVIESLKSSEDSPNNFGLYRKTLMPGGYMPAEFSSNPGLKVAYRYLKNTIDENARKAEMALFEAKTGLINSMTHLETLFGPGGGAELVKQWFKAKDDPTFQFSFTPAQQKVHALKEKLFTSMLEDINSFLPEGKQVAELPNYIPSIHDGKWYIEVKTGDGRPILYGAHNKFQLKAMQQYLSLKGYETSPIKVRGRYQDSRWGSNQFGDVNEVKAANYQYMLDLLTDTDPQVQALGKELTRQIDSQAYTASGVHNRFKEYTGYEGNLGNNPLKSERTNYFDAKKALIQTVESHYSWVAAQKANQLNKSIMESGIPPNNAALVSEYINSNVIGKSSKTFVDTIAHGVGENVLGMSPQQVNQITNRSGNIVTAMLTSMGSPVHALQNVVQPLTVIFPHLFKERGNYLDLTSALTKIPAEYAYVFAGKQLSEIAKLFGVEQGKYFGSKAFQTKMEFAQRTGIIDPTIVESTPMFQSKAANRATDFAVQGVLSRPTEQAARWAVFSSMYDLGVRKGLSVEKAASRAKEITETFMVDYGPDAKARMFTENGIVGNTMGRLQSFAANQLAQTFLYIKNSKKSPSDAMAAMTYFTTLAALGGIVGLPFFDLVEKLVNNVKSKDGKTFSLRNEMRQTVGDGAIEGLWGKVGLGVAPSFGARTIGDNNLPSVLGFPTAGKIGQIAEAGIRRANPKHSWATEPDSEKGKELLAVSPVAARSVIEDKFLKPSFGGKTVNISAETGRVLHEQQPGERSFGNIRSAERSKDADLNNQKFLEQQKQKEQSKKLEREIERRVLDTSLYGNKTQEKLERLNQDIMAYVQQGNNEADVEKLLNNSLAFAGISDAELAKMEKLAQANGDWKILNKVLMEKKYLDLRKAQKGIFNFSVGKKG